MSQMNTACKRTDCIIASSAQTPDKHTFHVKCAFVRHPIQNTGPKSIRAFGIFPVRRAICGARDIYDRPSQHALVSISAYTRRYGTRCVGGCKDKQVNIEGRHTCYHRCPASARNVSWLFSCIVICFPTYARNSSLLVVLSGLWPSSPQSRSTAPHGLAFEAFLGRRT